MKMNDYSKLIINCILLMTAVVVMSCSPDRPNIVTGNLPVHEQQDYEFIEAVKAFDLEKSQRIINEGVNIEKPSGELGRTALAIAVHLAQINDNDSMVKLLLRNGADPNARDRLSNPIITSCIDVNIIKLLVEHGADINAVDAENETAIFRLSNFLYGESGIRYLIGQGADVNHISARGWTPLIMAIFTNAENNVRVLLALNANVNYVNTQNGMTPILYSACFASDDIMRTLISNGANVNDRDHGGLTPLMYAAFKNTPDTIKLLLESGADTSAVDNQGQTAIDYAKTSLFPDDNINALTSFTR